MRCLTVLMFAASGAWASSADSGDGVLPPAGLRRLLLDGPGGGARARAGGGEDRGGGGRPRPHQQDWHRHRQRSDTRTSPGTARGRKEWKLSDRNILDLLDNSSNTFSKIFLQRTRCRLWRGCWPGPRPPRRPPTSRAGSWLPRGGGRASGTGTGETPGRSRSRPSASTRKLSSNLWRMFKRGEN